MSSTWPTTAIRLCRACNHIPRSRQQLRCISQSSPRHTGQPTSDATPDVEATRPTRDQGTMVVLEETPDPNLPSVPPSNKPDYKNAPVDHGTSTYSPVPRRIMDGSEPGETTPAAILSGAPVDLQARQVRIYKAAKPATQSGSWGSHEWRMDWDIMGKGHRWENPLMGWQSSADFMQGTNVKFKTKEDAINFAQKQGYEYFVQEPHERRVVPKAYANNFLHEPKPLKHIKTK